MRTRREQDPGHEREGRERMEETRPVIVSAGDHDPVPVSGSKSRSQTQIPYHPERGRPCELDPKRTDWMHLKCIGFGGPYDLILGFGAQEESSL